EELDRHDTRVRQESPRRLHPADPGEGGGQADGAALVTAHRQVGLTESDDDRAARRRPAGGVAHPVRVMHGPGRVRVAAARETEVLAVRLADDLAARIEDAARDGRVEVWHEALER